MYKNNIKRAIIGITIAVCGLLVTQTTELHAARLMIDAPENASSNGEPFSIIVYIDSEQDVLSAVSGEFVLDSTLFDVQGVTTRSSIISLWVTQPKVSAKYDDGKVTHIPFEGIIPGGYSGVRSPYYSGTKPGVLFAITLLPKKKGDARVLLQNIKFHLFDKNGTSILKEPVFASISVPEQSIVYSYVTKDLEETYSSTLEVTIQKELLINNNAWYLSVFDDESVRPIEHIYIAETGAYDPDDVKDEDWKEIKNIYVLKYQQRNKYIHVKVLYENRTYMIKTIPPVENTNAISSVVRILGSIVVICVLTLIYIFFRKKEFFYTIAHALNTSKKKTHSKKDIH